MKNVIIIGFLFLAQFIAAQDLVFPKTRPGEDNKPTKINVSYYILDIEEIDNKRQNFTIDIIIRLKWIDDRIKNEYSRVPLNDIWNPNIHIYNLREQDVRFPEVVSIAENGIVRYTQRYHATLNNALDFREFPFDVQTLKVSLMSFGYSPDEVELVFENAGTEPQFSISDWNIQPIGSNYIKQEANLFADQSEKIVRPKLDYELKASRYIQFYWWKILAPLMVILFLSWAVFWIDPTQVGAQIGVSGTSILTLIAFLYRLDNLLPPVSYLTRIDHFIFTSLLLVFFAYLEALVSVTIAAKGKVKMALNLDKAFRFGYPVLYLLLIYYYWIN
jgi:hypothetical protein